MGYEEAAAAGRGSGKSRNGYSSKTVIGDDGAIEIVVPRDRNSTVESQIVPKGQTRPIASSASGSARNSAPALPQPWRP